MMNFTCRSTFLYGYTLVQSPVAEFIDLWLGDKANSGIRLSYRQSGMSGYMAGGPVRQPYAGVGFIPQSGIYEIATGSESM